MSGNFEPRPPWQAQAYAYDADARPLLVAPPPNAYPPPADFSPHAPPAHYPFYPVHDVFAPAGVHRALGPGDYPHLEVAPERKHRRSRNGCFTCRTRRIKCDEKRPACNRCRKGCRECVYPSPTDVPKKKSKLTPSNRGVPRDREDIALDNNDDEDEDEDEDNDDDNDNDDDDIKRIKSESSASPFSSAAATDPVRDSSTSRSTCSTASTSVSSYREAGSPSISPQKHLTPRQYPRRRGASLPAGPPTTLSTVIESSSGTPKTYDFYLEYSKSKLTHHNYGLSHPAPELIPNYLFSAARTFKPLLHAVTAFAAYAYALQEEGASLNDFIFHYAESVADLRRYLMENQSAFQVPVLLTILQLATIEEYLGDWVNLINHQTAAFKVMTSIWTADTIMRDVHGRQMLNWYNHFDLFTSYMGGRATTLGRAWFQSQHEHYQSLSGEHPDNLDFRYAERHACLRLLGSDIASYFTQLASGELSEKTIDKTTAQFRRDLFNILEESGPLVDPSKRVRSTPSVPQDVHGSGRVGPDETSSSTPSDLDDAGNPYDSSEYYTEPLWSTNYLTLRCYGVYMMLLNHLLPKDFWRTNDQRPPGPSSSLSVSPPSSAVSAKAPRAWSNPPAELHRYAIKTCQLFAALSNHDPDPGAIMGCQAGLSLSSCFLGSIDSHPNSSLHFQWIREQLMRVECYGYVYPMGMRKRISDAWGVDVTDWWFPDGQGLSDTLRAVREFVVFRTRVPEDDLSEDVREMNGLFAAMKVGADSTSGGE